MNPLDACACLPRQVQSLPGATWIRKCIVFFSMVVQLMLTYPHLVEQPAYYQTYGPCIMTTAASDIRDKISFVMGMLVSEPPERNHSWLSCSFIEMPKHFLRFFFTFFLRQATLNAASRHCRYLQRFNPSGCSLWCSVDSHLRNSN